MIRAEVRVDDATLVLRGSGTAPAAVAAVGRRARSVGRPAQDGTRWRAEVPLRVERWGRPPLPLPSGDYALELDGIRHDLPAAASQLLPDMSVAIVDGVLSVGAPVATEDASTEGRRALEGAYAATASRSALENAVFFESFYGRNASCNPRALDAEIARSAPGVTRYWSVVDLSVAVPAGAVPVVEGTPEWWRARGAARLLVVNDWLRRRFVRRPGQRVLQTWHGTPLKRLALHRPGFDPRRALAVLRESRRWDVLLAQNPYAARTLAKAYAFLRRPVWVEGYPRNDILVGGDPAPVRTALGIGADERVVLYAPTWRDDREQIVDFLDLERLARETAAVVLVRGHSRTLIPGRDSAGARVVDVTGYPDISELLLVADALVTDYSSVMFDFSATGKPMYFFVPDLDRYRGELRGFYFDLADRAPGPVTSTQEELTEAITDAGTAARYAERYAEWAARFNARDDGRAAERVVARILDQGMLLRD